MKLAIKGHPERGREVLNLLKSLGGEEKASTQWSYSYEQNLYYVDNNGEINYGFAQNTLYQTTYKIYTLEEFEELYPFKVGDKVQYTGTALSFNKDNTCTITGLHWNHALNQVFYILDNQYLCSHLWIAPMKKKELKDYLKPGYVVEYEEGNKFVITQDVHGNMFGIQLGNADLWSSLTSLDSITKVYQIDKPGCLHKRSIANNSLTLVWEKPKETELTMQQIADKFGIDVNQLKIKK